MIDTADIRALAHKEMLEEIIRDLEDIVTGKSNLDYNDLIRLYKEFSKDYSKYFDLQKIIL